jgi:chloramphenicol-sensitive protein RarD
LLLSVNWLVHVRAISAGRIVDASLGYFINPFVTVLLGVWLLGDRPRPLQWLAVANAGAGVGWLVLGAGEWPWISLVLAAASPSTDCCSTWGRSCSS